MWEKENTNELREKRLKSEPEPMQIDRAPVPPKSQHVNQPNEEKKVAPAPPHQPNEPIIKQKVQKMPLIPVLQEKLNKVLQQKDSRQISEAEINEISECLQEVILQDISLQAIIDSNVGVLIKQFYEHVHSEPALKILDLLSKCAFRKLKRRACESIFGKPSITDYPLLRQEPKLNEEAKHVGPHFDNKQIVLHANKAKDIKLKSNLKKPAEANKEKSSKEAKYHMKLRAGLPQIKRKDKVKFKEQQREHKEKARSETTVGPITSLKAKPKHPKKKSSHLTLRHATRSQDVEPRVIKRGLSFEEERMRKLGMPPMNPELSALTCKKMEKLLAEVS